MRLAHAGPDIAAYSWFDADMPLHVNFDDQNPRRRRTNVPSAPKSRRISVGLVLWGAAIILASTFAGAWLSLHQP